MAATTERVRLGSCIVNSWTRGPALMAMTFATLDNLAPGRMNVGLGAYWDPLAWKQGIERRKPLTQMREYIGVLRRLLALEDGVTHEGELVRVRDLTLDLGHGDARVPPAVKIFIGPTGTPDDGAFRRGRRRRAHQRHPLARLHAAARWSAWRQGPPAPAARSPTWRSCSSSTSRWTPTADKALYDAKRLVTQYLGQQPHFAKAWEIPRGPPGRDFKQRDGRLAAPKPGGIEEAMALVDDALVDELIAHGTPERMRAPARNAGSIPASTGSS